MTPLFQVLLVGVGTYLLRVSLVALLGRVEVPERVSDALQLVTPAVLAALVARGLFIEEGGIRSLDPWHGAALTAAVVAWRTKSVTWTLIAGMASVWALSAAFG